MALQEKEKTILAAASALVVVATAYFWTLPVLNEQNKFIKDIHDLKAEMRNPKYREEDIEVLTKELENLNNEIGSLKAQIPSSARRGILIRDLETLARNNMIEIKSFVPREAVAIAMGGQEINKRIKTQMRKKNQIAPKGKVLKTAINIDSSGKFQDYRNFFEGIITYYKAVDISDINITRVGDKAAGAVQDARFSKGRGASIMDSIQDDTLSVTFTLNAYTSIPNDEQG